MTAKMFNSQHIYFLKRTRNAAVSSEMSSETTELHAKSF